MWMHVLGAAAALGWIVISWRLVLIVGALAAYGVGWAEHGSRRRDPVARLRAGLLTLAPVTLSLGGAAGLYLAVLAVFGGIDVGPTLDRVLLAVAAAGTTLVAAAVGWFLLRTLPAIRRVQQQVLADGGYSEEDQERLRKAGFKIP